MLSRVLEGHIPVDRFKLRGKNFYPAITKTIKRNYFLVNAKHGWKKRRTCPLCGSSGSRFEFKRLGVDIVACLNCSLRYLTRIPANPDDIYSDLSYLQKTHNSYTKFQEYRRKRFGKERIGLIQKYSGSIKHKRLLDVGSGNGYFLEAAKEAGAKCAGIELGDYVRNWSIKKNGIPVLKTRLEDLSGKDDFDIVTMFDLLEHVPDPSGLLRAAKKHLVPGGIIVVFTPNFDSFGIRYMKEKSNLVVPTEHLSYFTKEALKFAFNSAGMEIIYLETRGMDIADVLFYLESRATRNTGLTNFLKKWQDDLQAMIDISGCANHLRVIARKKSKQ